jgi:hypothetical protein
MKPEVGTLLELAPRSNYGVLLLKQFGNLWEIVELALVVKFDIRVGDWARLRSVDGKEYWCLLNQDSHVTISSAV